MKYLRLVLGFLSMGAVSAGMSTAQAATIAHSYALNNSLADAYGGPSLIADPDGVLSLNGYSFAANDGLSLLGAIDPNNYSILMDYSLSDVAGYNKVIDFKNLTTDRGLYQHNGFLDFYTPGSNQLVTVGDNVMGRMVLTRDGATNITTGYFNGTQMFAFDDSSLNIATFAPNNIINFFESNNADISGGLVQKIVIYNGALTSLEVNALGTVGTIVPGTEVPEPFTIVGTLVGGTAALRMRKKLKASDKV